MLNSLIMQVTDVSLTNICLYSQNKNTPVLCKFGMRLCSEYDLTWLAGSESWWWNARLWINATWVWVLFSIVLLRKTQCKQTGNLNTYV